MKNKKWFRLLAFVPFVVFVVFVNAYIDPANIIHDQSENIADSMLKGHAVYVGSGNVDERSVKMHFIKGLPKHIDCICMGPSLSMGVRKSNAGTENFYNLSFSSMTFYEYLAVLGMLQLNGVHFDRVIFCVDSLFFDKKQYVKSTGPFSSHLMGYAAYMLELLDAKKPEKHEESYMTAYNIIRSLRPLRQMVSVTYFQEAINLIEKYGSFKQPEKRSGIVDKTTEDFAHYMADGSWVYPLERREKTIDYVLEECAKHDSKDYFSKGTHLDDYSKETFCKLIDYLRANGVAVEFYLCPLAPSLWDRIKAEPDADEYHILYDLEPFALKIAADYGIKVTGSHNPYNVGIQDSDFLDARHVRHEKLATYFDFTK